MNLPVCADTGHRGLRGPKYLHKDFHDEPCQNAESERRQIGEVLDRWMDRIEEDCGLKTPDPEPCYPEFTCFGSFAKKKPLCRPNTRVPLITNLPIYERRLVSERQRVADMDERVKIVFVEDTVKDVPVWERPRIRSQRLIGGEFKKLTDCFKKNGLNIADCPRTPSCRVIGSMQEWIEMDKKRDKVEDLIECCCCPGSKSMLPQFKCVTCEPPAAKRGLPQHHRKGSTFKKRSDEKVTHSDDNRSTPSKYTRCLNNKNPRSSAEIWVDDNLDIFGHHT